MPSRVITIQDRLCGHAALDGLSFLYGRVERDLYCEIMKGRSFTGDLAKTFYQAYGISAKNLDHIHNNLKAQLDSVREGALLNATQLREKITGKSRDIARREKQIAKAINVISKQEASNKPDTGIFANQRRMCIVAEKAVHQHKRRREVLRHRLTKAESRAADVRLCFGSRSLLAARNRIMPDDVEGIAAWKKEWSRRRSGEIFIPGDVRSADGNFFVRIEPQEDGRWMLVLRLPQALVHLADRTVCIAGRDVHEVLIGSVRFKHGATDFAAAIAAHVDGAPTAHAAGPITWRIQPHAKGGWLVSCTLRQQTPDIAVPDYRNGALGVDFNAGFLAVTLNDSDGNPRRHWRFPLVTHSRSSDQNKDACRKAALRVSAIAKAHQVPVVAEMLDFSKKKAAVTTDQGARYARMLNGLTHAAFGVALESACARQGVMLRRMNPAYTSIIGFAKFANRYGISVHSAAACAIARRGQRFSERVPDQVGIMLVAGVQGTLPRPEVRHSGAEAGIADKAGKGRRLLSSRRHVWASWSGVSRGRNAALTACLQSLREKRSIGSSGRPKGRAGSDGSTGGAGVGVPGASPRARGLRGAGWTMSAGMDDQVVHDVSTGSSG
jgi:hypothetical protein